MSAAEGEEWGMENPTKADVKIGETGGWELKIMSANLRSLFFKLYINNRYIILFTFTDANPTEFLPLINCLGGHFGLKVTYRWQNFKSTKYVRSHLPVMSKFVYDDVT